MGMENGFIMFFGKFNKKIIFIEKNLYFINKKLDI